MLNLLRKRPAFKRLSVDKTLKFCAWISCRKSKETLQSFRPLSNSTRQAYTLVECSLYKCLQSIVNPLIKV